MNEYWDSFENPSLFEFFRILKIQNLWKNVRIKDESNIIRRLIFRMSFEYSKNRGNELELHILNEICRQIKEKL